jgi:hypothetical protein
MGIVTMDSGLLHLAACTEAHIYQLGSSIDPFFRTPYRHGTQYGHRMHYIHGSCKLKCASDLKHGVKQWGNIQGVPPLIGCLEGKETFECHPSVQDIYYQLCCNL